MSDDQTLAKAPKALRPRLPVNRDNAFWIEGVRAGKLLVQRCNSCAALRYPPAPMCGCCQSLDWETAQISGSGLIYSYVVHHKPPLPGFTTPYAILLVELKAGIRVLGNLVDAPIEVLKIGLPVEVVFRTDPGDDYVLPHWRPRGAS